MMIGLHAKTALSCLLALLFVSTCAPKSRWNILPEGRLVSSAITESSGIVASRRFDDVLWTHNDGVKEPFLFAIDDDGRLLRTFLVRQAENIDWEDIAIDEEHRLFIFDNTSRTHPQGHSRVYVVPEPDPFTQAEVQVERVIAFDFPDGPQDCEAMFIWQGIIYLITKPWDGSPPRIYQVDSAFAHGTATFLAEFPQLNMVTAADISRDGKRIAIASYTALAVVEGDGLPAELLKQEARLAPLNAGQIEAVTWKDDEVILTNEQGEIFDVTLEQLAEGVAPFFRTPETTVPRVKISPTVDLPLEKWSTGRWLHAQGSADRLARVAWNEDGIHLGLISNSRLALIEQPTPGNYDTWFKEGTIYLLFNPNGRRPLLYGPNDYCIVIGRSEAGHLMAQARALLPATVIKSFSNNPPWLGLSIKDNRILVHLKPEAPGLILQAQNQVGLNVLLVNTRARMLSWAPLTLEYTWDSPNFWGRARLEP